MSTTTARGFRVNLPWPPLFPTFAGPRGPTQACHTSPRGAHPGRRPRSLRLECGARRRIPGEVVPAEAGQRLILPTVLLQDHATFSAAEDFLITLDAVPHVTKVGRPSGGSTGQPLFPGPTGWRYGEDLREARHLSGRSGFRRYRDHPRRHGGRHAGTKRSDAHTGKGVARHADRIELSSPQAIGGRQERRRPLRRAAAVARDGVEPPTRGFSVRCSTN